jgi:hypothetical protein
MVLYPDAAENAEPNCWFGERSWLLRAQVDYSAAGSSP